MKRRIVSVITVLAVLMLVWAAFGQQQERGQRFSRYRQAQLEAVEVIQEQAAKLKADMEAMARPEGRASFENLPEEERAKLREGFTKRREEQQKAIAVIELQIARLKGQRQLKAEHEGALTELQEIRQLALKEKAEETAKRLMQLILKRNKEFEANMQKLGLEQSRPRS
jgi:hypothetical protein